MKLLLLNTILLLTMINTQAAGNEYQNVRGDDLYIHHIESGEIIDERGETGLYCKVEDSSELYYFQLRGLTKGSHVHVWNERSYNVVAFGRNAKMRSNKEFNTMDMRAFPVTFEFIKFGNNVDSIVNTFSLERYENGRNFELQRVSVTINDDLKGHISLNALKNIKTIDCSYHP